MRRHPDGDSNNLLQAIKAADRAVLDPCLEEWSAPTGTVLHEPGDTVRHAYFPLGSSLISYLVVLSDGRSIQTALIGREGAGGGIVSQGRVSAYSRAEVQLGGGFLRIDLHRLEEAKLKSVTLRHLFARYADCLMAQIFQSVACNAVHSIEQRTAKWLLAGIDRTGVDNVQVTQEQLAGMLGVGRSYLSRVIQQLRRRSLIETSRAYIVVRDIDGLRALACECNAAVTRHFDEVLKGIYPQTH